MLEMSWLPLQCINPWVHPLLLQVKVEAKTFGFICLTWGSTSYILQDKFKHRNMLWTCWVGTEGSGLFNISEPPFFHNTELTAFKAHTSACLNWFLMKQGPFLLGFPTDPDKLSKNRNSPYTPTHSLPHSCWCLTLHWIFQALLNKPKCIQFCNYRSQATI